MKRIFIYMIGKKPKHINLEIKISQALYIYIITSCVGTLGHDQLWDVENFGKQLTLGD